MTDTTKDKLPTQETVNIFLDELRESGITNMYGATPYIQTEFGFPKARARDYLTDYLTQKKGD